jgi:hypothetical protein
VRRVAPAALLGWASHYLLDHVPHTDIMPLLGAASDAPVSPAGVAIAAVDTVVATALGLRLARGQPERRAMLAAGFMATLPDLLDNIPAWSPRLWRFRPFRLQGYLHRYSSRPLGPSQRYRGILPQVAVAAGALALTWLARRSRQSGTER